MFNVIWVFRSNKVQWSLYKLYQHVTHVNNSPRHWSCTIHRDYIVQRRQRCGYEILRQCHTVWEWCDPWQWQCRNDENDDENMRMNNNNWINWQNQGTIAEHQSRHCDTTGPANLRFSSQTMHVHCICYRWYNCNVITKHDHGVRTRE